MKYMYFKLSEGPAGRPVGGSGITGSQPVQTGEAGKVKTIASGTKGRAKLAKGIQKDSKQIQKRLTQLAKETGKVDKNSAAITQARKELKTDVTTLQKELQTAQESGQISDETSSQLTALITETLNQVDDTNSTPGGTESNLNKIMDLANDSIGTIGSGLLVRILNVVNSGLRYIIYQYYNNIINLFGLSSSPNMNEKDPPEAFFEVFAKYKILEIGTYSHSSDQRMLQRNRAINALNVCLETLGKDGDSYESRKKAAESEFKDALNIMAKDMGFDVGPDIGFLKDEISSFKDIAILAGKLAKQFDKLQKSEATAKANIQKLKDHPFKAEIRKQQRDKLVANLNVCLKCCGHNDADSQKRVHEAMVEFNNTIDKIADFSKRGISNFNTAGLKFDITGNPESATVTADEIAAKADLFLQRIKDANKPPSDQ